ncbi:hypothetical protein ABG768_026376 [Culter alburnus]|uniref:Tankyrase 1-binding protein C-terminal domain-containing protein n=1 Tax=Culter alburnus TaxID=194366 RepID=A0AAW2A9X7_CULAL
MEYLGDKLSVAHSQMSGWMGNVRRSLQGALNLVSSSVERRSGGGGGEEGGGFKRAASLRSLASRSRESFRRFSLRSQQRLSLRRRTTSLASPSTPSSELLKQSVSGREENKDTDNLVQETDSQYGTWETGLRTDDSLTPATPSSEGNLTPSPRKSTPPQSAEPSFLIDTPDGSITSPHKQTELPFPETTTTLLDSSALRARVNLNKKSTRRAPPSRAARHSALLSQVPEGTGEGDDEWRYKDSTEEKSDSSKKGEESDSEEQAKGIDSRTSSMSQPQRVALFPGMDPSALKAQLKKRGESDNQTDGPSPSQLSRSPKSPFLPRASRVLPPAGGKENGEESSPQWLKELKTKKRLSQYESDSTA